MIFVHHFGGDRKTPTPHIRLVNELGFHAVSFSMSFNESPLVNGLVFNSEMQLGLITRWQEEIETIFNAVPYKKIAYTFSSPSASAASVLARRGARDVNAWICDGGPFLDTFTNTLRYVEQVKIKNKLLQWGLSALGTLIYFGLDYKENLYKSLEKLPQDFPVLSIRGWQDPLVPYSAIEKAFSPHKHLDLEVLALTEGTHLDGLKKYPDEYRKRVEVFLRTHSKQL